MSALNEFKKLLEEASSEQKKKAHELEEQESIVNKTARYLQTNNDNTPAAPEDIENERWNDPLLPLDQKFVTVKQMNDHYGLFLQRIQQQMSTMTGGGEVNFRYLDDVNRSTMTPSNDNYVLEYDANTEKVQFTTNIGPMESISFDITHINPPGSHPVGSLSWSVDDQTLNLEHPGGVTQQIGQEQYAKVRNGTANTIVNGTAVQFIGAEQNGTARLLVGPMVADGTSPSLYGLGIATQDIEPGEDGRVTVWGKVRDLDMSQFQVGDILYVSANTAGELTNVKPTAPNNVMPIAAVLNNDSQIGEIFVRPTIEQQEYYGRFSRLTDQTAANANTATAVVFDTIEIQNGIQFNGGSNTEIQVTDSGFYQFDLSAQVSASSNKGVVYFWFRKNGVDIEHSTRSTTVTNGDTFNVSTSISISLNATDYVEVMWARTAAGIILDARSATAFAPSTASVMLNVTQVQL